MMKLIETKRLVLRPWEPEDLPYFVDMNQDEDVMRYFPTRMTAEQSEESYQRALTHQSEYGFCFWAAELKEVGHFIGFIGLQNTWFEAYFTPCVEIGWRLMKEYWGRGLAPEGATACLEWAAKHNINEVYSFTPESNLPSQRVMQKIGMTQVGTFEHPKLEEDSPLRRHVLYNVQLIMNNE